MREHIVATFENESSAASATRALEEAGIPPSAIRRYAADDANAPVGQPAVGAATTGSKPAGGFWAWLLGEEGPSVTRAADYGHDPDLYDHRARAGSTILAITITDDSQIHRAVEIIESYDPVDIDERTDERASSLDAGAATVATTGSRSSSAEVIRPGASADIASADVYGRSAGGATADVSGDEVIPLAEEQLEVGKRTVDRGTTRIRRYVVETPVEREVTLRGERVTIERRRPVGTEAGAPGGAFEERTIEVRETEEVPVVGKTAHVAEEVVVHREGTDRTETVRDTIRREEVEITPSKASSQSKNS